MVTDTVSYNPMRGGQSRPRPIRRLIAMAQHAVSQMTEPDSLAIDGKRLRMPQWVVLALFTLMSGALGGAYFMGSLAAEVRHEAEYRGKLENQVETYRVEVDALKNQVSTLRGRLEGAQSQGRRAE